LRLGFDVKEIDGQIDIRSTRVSHSCSFRCSSDVIRYSDNTANMLPKGIATYSVSYIVDEFRIVIPIGSFVDYTAGDFEVLDNKSMTIAVSCYVLTG
jgi:hypothetical protein